MDRATCLLAPEEEVVDDVEVVAQREVLVDARDPELGRVMRVVDLNRVAVEVDFSLVGGADARDRLDQRRLAGAVVADQRHDLARVHVEVDLAERVHGAEVLGHPPQAQQRAPGGRRRSGAGLRLGRHPAT